MDTIRFEINKKANKQYRKFYDVVLFLNDKPIQHDTFNIASVLAAYRCNYAEFFPFTCTCGQPGCAGFSKEVKQFRKNALKYQFFVDSENTKIKTIFSLDDVIWEFPNIEEYKVDKLVYKFDAKQFDLQLDVLKHLIINLSKKGELSVANLGDLDIKDNINTIGEINYYRKRFRRASKSYENLSLNFPEYINNTYYYKYEEQISWEYDFRGLVYKLIGEQPEYVEEEFNMFLLLCRVGARAIVQFLSDDKLVFSSIFENKNLSDLCYKLNDIDNFDLTKLELVQK